MVSCAGVRWAGGLAWLVGRGGGVGCGGVWLGVVVEFGVVVYGELRASFDLVMVCMAWYGCMGVVM